MRALAILSLISLVSFAGALEKSAKKVRLENGLELHIEEVTISGVLTNKNKTWSFDAKVDESSFVDTHLLVLEIVAELPSNKSLQPAGKQLR